MLNYVLEYALHNRLGSKIIPWFIKRYLNFNIRIINEDVTRVVSGIETSIISFRNMQILARDRIVVVKL